MLLGNTHVKVAGGETAVELHHARALAHGRRDAHQARIVLGHVAQPLTKHLGEGGFGFCVGLDQPHRRVKLARAVVGHRVGLGQLVALAFFGDHVQELRAFEVLDIFQRGDEGFKVMAVNRADVVEAKCLKQRGRHHHAFGMFFNALGQFKQGRRDLQHLLAHVLGGGIKLPAHELRQITVERAHGRADAHVVVVQDHQQLAVFHTTVVQRLKRHARRHGPVTNDGHGVAVLALEACGNRHAQGGGDRGAGVRRAKGVVLAFTALWEATQAAQLTQ